MAAVYRTYLDFSELTPPLVYSVVLAFFGWTEGFDEVLKLMDRFAREAGLPSR